jgi:hypothetical protein
MQSRLGSGRQRLESDPHGDRQIEPLAAVEESARKDSSDDWLLASDC